MIKKKIYFYELEIELSYGTRLINLKDIQEDDDYIPIWYADLDLKEKFRVSILEQNVLRKFNDFVIKYYSEYDIPCPSFSVSPMINGKSLNVELSEEIQEELDCDEVDCFQLQKWINTKSLMWFRNYRLTNEINIE
jgi:hypothetical protein